MNKFLALFALVSAVSCSVLPDDGSWRIVGGDTAAVGQFPYIISLRGPTGSHSCGGSILNENWILTAAHCVDGRSPRDLTVVAGTNELNSGGERHSVSRIVMHEDYDSWNIVNDIALLELSSPLSFGDLIQPIELEASEIGGGTEATLCGWGRTSYPGNIPNDLQFIDLRTITLNECRNAQSPNQVADSNICTFTQEGEGACHGDSGGPLTANGKQIGVVSWGRPCAIGYPDVFTRVSSFVDWVNSNMA